MVLDGAEPFYFAGGSTGVLLLHGLTGSPAEMRLLGEALSKEGFTISDSEFAEERILFTLLCNSSSEKYSPYLSVIYLSIDSFIFA